MYTFNKCQKATRPFSFFVLLFFFIGFCVPSAYALDGKRITTGNEGGDPPSGYVTPSIIQNVAVTRSANMALITYTTDPAASTTFYWDTSQIDGQADDNSVPSSGTSHTIFLTGLAIDTPYYYRIFADIGSATECYPVANDCARYTSFTTPHSSDPAPTFPPASNPADNAAFNVTGGQPLNGSGISFTVNDQTFANTGGQELLKLEVVTKPSWVTCNGLDGYTRNIPITRLCTGTPAAGNVGTNQTLTLKATDGGNLFINKTVTINVASANQPPTANGQSVSVFKNIAQSVTLTGSDPEGHALTFSIVANPSHGTLLGTAPNVTYTPAANYAGADSFTFKVNDGTQDSTPATVSITVTNNSPTANPQPVSTPQNTARAITLTGSDPNNDSLTFSIVTNPTHGTLSGTAPNVTYTPTSGYTGADSFTFKVNDGTVDSSPATVTITVTAPNTAPIFTSPATTEYSVAAGDTLSGPITFTAQDTAGESVALSVGSSPPWITCVAQPGTNPATSVCSANGIAPEGEIGQTRTLSMIAADNRTPSMSTTKSVSIYVTKFKDVTSINLPTDTNETPGADFGDVNGDGFKDLVIAHPYGAALGDRVWINKYSTDPAGKFTDRTSVWLSAAYKSQSVKLAQHPGTRLDLYLSNWTGPSTAYAKRLKNLGNFNTAESMESCGANATWSLARDIETIRTPGAPNPWGAIYANYVSSAGCGHQEKSGFFDWNDALTNTGYVFPYYDGGTSATNPAGVDVEVADVDGDGRSDIYFTGAWELPTLWIQSSDGLRFNKSSVTLGGVDDKLRAAFADLNNDNKPDLVLVSPSTGLKIYQNTWPTFSLVATNPGGVTASDTKEVAVGDLTGDGTPDIFLIGNGARREKVLVNNGAFGFAYDPAILPISADDSNGALIFDIDQDGDNDIFIYNVSGGNKLYKNIQ